MGGLGIGIAPHEILQTVSLGGGGPPPWTPTDVAGLVLWLTDTGVFQDLAKAIPAVLDGDPIFKWEDQSGSGNDVGAEAAAKRPLLKLTIQNGRNIVRFDALDDFFRVLPSIIGIGAIPVTILAICRPIDSGGNLTLIFSGSAGATAAYWTMITTQPAQSYTRAMYGANVSNDRWTATNSVTTGVFSLFTFQWDGNAVSATNPKFWLNGASEASVGGVGVGVPNLGNFSTIVGADRISGNLWKDDMGEILVYDSVLSAPNLAAAHNYLNSRWAVY